MFDTVKPGRVPGPNGALQAPHILVAIHMRGILQHVFTRIYFSDEASNADDPILKLVPADRRETLVATRDPAKRALPHRFPHPGRPGDGVFRYLRAARILTNGPILRI